MTHSPGTYETKEHTQSCLIEIASMQMKGLVGPNPLWVCGCPPITQEDIDSRSVTALKFIANGFRHIEEQPAMVAEGGTCVQAHGKCICVSKDYCQKESTRIYSFNDSRLDKCYKRLPCEDHAEMQPAPIANDLPAVWGMVMKDMVDRDQLGRKRYGVPLQPHNGRDALQDAYEEALDLVVYLRQAIYEREAATVKVPDWCKWGIEETK